MISKPPNSPALGEFGLIARYFAPLATHSAARGLQDDVAVLAVGDSPGDLVLNVDAIVSGVHFLPDETANAVAERVLRVNLSDLAAKGAEPIGYLLTLALPSEIDEAWLAGFSTGLKGNQQQFGWSLLGGDTVRTPGPLTISVTALGRVPAGKAPKRGGAQVGDQIWVSGTIGDAALGLAVCLGQGPQIAGPLKELAVRRFRQPEPRLKLGQAIVKACLATASADISDGLAADLGHIAEASSLAAAVDGSAVPFSQAGLAALALDQSWFMRMIAGGDDYELLFSAPPDAAEPLTHLAASVGVPLTMIGLMTTGAGVQVTDRKGQPLSLTHSGYTHF